MRLLTLGAAALAGGQFTPPAEIGDSYLGGYFAGVIDTTRPGSIHANDEYQTGARYALIVSPKTLQKGDGVWRDTSGGGVPNPTEARTLWDGLSVAQALTDSAYVATAYCNALSYPSDGASQWYLPALHELALLYYNLKPRTLSNTTGSLDTSTGTDPFPGTTIDIGENPSSRPQHVAYTTGHPVQTDIADFQLDGSEAIHGPGAYSFHSATIRSSGNNWRVDFASGGWSSGSMVSSLAHIRPVRRFYL